MTRPIILASSSATRKAMLAENGVRFETASPRLDEETIRASLAAEGVTPRDMADALAEAKAQRVGGKHPGALVIGADQILEHDGAALGKAETREALKAQLGALSGKRHLLHSAAVIWEGDRPVWRHVATVRMIMRVLSEDFIDAYVDEGWEELRHSVGGYLIEAGGARLFSSIEGSHFAILGLPLMELLSYLILRGEVEI